MACAEQPRPEFTYFLNEEDYVYEIFSNENNLGTTAFSATVFVDFINNGGDISEDCDEQIITSAYIHPPRKHRSARILQPYEGRFRIN